MTTENLVGHDVVALDARVVRATVSVVSQRRPGGPGLAGAMR